jgi:hypothetical protein
MRHQVLAYADDVNLLGDNQTWAIQPVAHRHTD